MSKIIEALKALYVKLGGTASTVADITQTPDMINAIAQVYEDKGDTLPAVTPDDNSKLLTVVGGKWDKANAPTELPAVSGTDNGKLLGVAEGAWAIVDAPTGNDDYIINFTKSDDKWTSDKTANEIASAFSQHKNLVLKNSYNGYFVLTYFRTGSSIEIHALDGSGTTAIVYQASIGAAYFNQPVVLNPVG